MQTKEKNELFSQEDREVRDERGSETPAAVRSRRAPLLDAALPGMLLSRGALGACVLL